MLQELKEHVASNLSHHQKEVLKSVLRKVHLYSPRPEQVYLESVVSNSPSLFFIQIGANDGQDFVRTVLGQRQGRHKISGILVEPQRYFYEKLQSTYDGVQGVELLNVAISDTDKSLTLYHVDYDHQDLPDWAKGLGSFSKAVLLSHSHLIQDLESKIRELPVKCMTVSELLKRSGGAQLDVLITDTEGHDFVILKQFDFATVKPKLIIYESKHLSPADFAACEKMLLGVGYKVTHLNNDNSVAVLNQP
jgi:FkbM family methyltransferase